MSLPALAAAASASAGLTTEGERSGFIRTGRYDELQPLIERFAQAYPQAVRLETFGVSPEGRPLLAMVVSRTGVLSADQARRKDVPVLLVQGGIHSGEIEGKDAGFIALREMLEGKVAPKVLDQVVIVFVPVYNVDGHERFRAWNRPNQNGPAQMGQRATAQNLNLNRDYIKVDAPETRAMLDLVNRWDPIVTLDIHATDGAKFQHDASIQMEPLHEGDAGLMQLGQKISDGLLGQLRKQGSTPLPFYPSLLKNDDPTSGFADNVYLPRFSTGYFQLRNRYSILLETHSWKTYAQRVEIARNTIIDLASMAARDGARWLQQAQAADQLASSGAPLTVPLDFKATETFRTIDFLGYAYTRTSSDVSGGLWTQYDDSKPQVWKVPLYDKVVPTVSADAPGAGYIVPAAYAAKVADLLDAHGVRYERLEAARPGAPVEVFHAATVELAAKTFESRQRATVTGQWAGESRDVAVGSLYVPIAQPKARLVVTLFEPLGPDSLLAWGMFNSSFQQQEYMEAYVAEAVAREQLRDPEMAKAFQARLASDAAFAASPAQRLAFFARRHASAEPALNLYPVYRIAR
ncbi:M14 family metallopeptidase [Pseudoxanthomonas sp.]|uniref:M14 family metallopeptidase n=1 Tax=Pseudoxanthomonas sp. TaxID=1871049 RepID=UPI00260E741D|nr:M14 family metallopeptidase [Pseudoxanthomonas sp.]WDS38084.1 MAG: M14 family metallopeptidase [Pseudoxanthomonas sp.]